MSAIAKQLAELEITPKRGEDRQDFLNRAVKEVAGLKDADWDSLDQETQDWYNAAADAKNAKAKTLPDFPDLAPPEEEKTSTRRRSAAKEDEPEAKTPGTKAIDPGKVKVKMAVKVVTTRGKELSGTVVEIDKEVLVLKMGNGDEEELGIDRIDVIYTLDTAAEDGPADPIKVGSMVTLTTKRGKIVAGKIVELGDELVVLKTDDGEEEFARERVESIQAMATGKGGAKDEPKSTRRGEAKDEPKDEGKAKRSSNPAGVSVGGRIRELMCSDLDITAEEVEKVLKKEGLEFRPTTLNMIFKDTAAVISALRENKKLK